MRMDIYEILVFRHYSSALFTGALRGRVRDVVCDGIVFGWWFDLMHMKLL
jgi:hypothetical protein